MMKLEYLLAALAALATATGLALVTIAEHDMQRAEMRACLDTGAQADDCERWILEARR